MRQSSHIAGIREAARWYTHSLALKQGSVRYLSAFSSTFTIPLRYGVFIGLPGLAGPADRPLAADAQSTSHNMYSNEVTDRAARHALRDAQGHLPDYKQLVTTPTGLQNVTGRVIDRGILGHYHRARGFLYPHRPSSPANDWTTI